MWNPSPAFRKAEELLRQDPLPKDAADRLAQLEKEIRPDEGEMFGQLQEALFVATDGVEP